MTHAPIMTATCACGRVQLKAFGAPIVSAVCYCGDCRKGAAQIEALPNASAVRDPDSGTAYSLYRKDRFECSEGAELLKPYKLKDTSPTNRVVATCCNSAMFVNFDRGPHWVSAYRARLNGELPSSVPDLHKIQTGRRRPLRRRSEFAELSSGAHRQASRGADRDGAGTIGRPVPATSSAGNRSWRR